MAASLLLDAININSEFRPNFSVPIMYQFLKGLHEIYIHSLLSQCSVLLFDSLHLYMKAIEFII